MEEPQTPPLLPPPPATFVSSTIDTSRPFSSVKEAISVFGKKHLAQEIFHSSSPNNYQKSPMWKSSPKINPTKTNKPDDRNDQNTLVCTVKKLEAELEATKTELKLLKEREEDTEVAVASLNAELHKNMSKIAKAEAAAAAKAAVVARTESIKERERRMEEESLPTMAQILGGGEEGKGLFGEREKERGGGKVANKKQQPIVPLVWKLFSRRKGSSTPSVDSSLFSSPQVFSPFGKKKHERYMQSFPFESSPVVVVIKKFYLAVSEPDNTLEVLLLIQIGYASEKLTLVLSAHDIKRREKEVESASREDGTAARYCEMGTTASA
ncbi:hypothetical protein RHSIM_Rhsim05G0186200 [Rhododendron simsii]|uniref:WEB family protein n=1 Tax=Rhododendron simsii TaxID=118357 RepID=A0A834GWJ9_RHOSS|nr:hypothetical protein RHSIM_Rhsim05G0186200 [Rhododendron simsii]